ncbi:hypothetical protein ScPMuIL_001364 [Solemya velum]
MFTNNGNKYEHRPTQHTLTPAKSALTSNWEEMNTMGVLAILLLFSVCISITWSSDVIDLEKARKRKALECCPCEMRDCLADAKTPRQKRHCVFHFVKCIRSALGDDSFQSLRRHYKKALDRFQGVWE